MTILAFFAALISIGGWCLIRLSEESIRQQNIIDTILATPIDTSQCACPEHECPI